jgi:hypothetical protein
MWFRRLPLSSDSLTETQASETNVRCIRPLINVHVQVHVESSLMYLRVAAAVANVNTEW